GVRVIATGPLTSQPLAEAIRTLAGQDQLYFFDAMAPIVMAESIDMRIAWRGNRWSRGAGEPGGRGAGEDNPSPIAHRPSSSVGDYINCPLSRDEYYAFVDAVNQAEKISLREFELPAGVRA
ncbi:MAG: FAD-dependent oxidoreductase, partial [Anaerolineae bacterium]|nr:FAD-dependent oxidoreductase [Anaerolineae bacterium]